MTNKIEQILESHVFTYHGQIINNIKEVEIVMPRPDRYCGLHPVP